MALNSPVIAGAPVTTRASAKTVVGLITNIEPPALRLLTVDGSVVVVDQSPDREGQMLFYRNGSELSVTMYVVVELDGLLVWKEVQNWGIAIDPRTGLEKDPNLNFYSTLAS
jgi:hypothetical protein